MKELKPVRRRKSPLEAAEPRQRNPARKAATKRDRSDANSSGAGVADEVPADRADEDRASLRAIALVANLFVPEYCAFCGNKIRQPGYVILDYDELGTFCSESCGDKGFREFLHEESE